jgi:hypothetical protein
MEGLLFLKNEWKELSKVEDRHMLDCASVFIKL